LNHSTPKQGVKERYILNESANQTRALARLLTCHEWKEI